MRQPVRFVVWWYRCVLFCAFGFCALLLVSMIAAGDNRGAAVYAGLGLLVVVYLTARAARSATIELRESEVVIFGLIRTRRVEWSQVRAVNVARGSSAALLPWRVPAFELVDGSTLLADDVRSLRTDSIVDDVVTAARDRIDDPGDSR